METLATDIPSPAMRWNTGVTKPCGERREVDGEGLRCSRCPHFGVEGQKRPEDWRKLRHNYLWASSLSSFLPRGNLLPNLTAKDIKTCRFHPEKAPFCPILRVGDVVKFAGQDFAKLARTVRTCLLSMPLCLPGKLRAPIDFRDHSWDAGQ